MFESLLIRPNKTRRYAVDVGQIMESLLFYQQTTLHIGVEDLAQLVENADVDTIEELLKRPEISIQFNNSHTAISYREDSKYGTLYYVDILRVTNLDIEEKLYYVYYKYSNDDLKSKEFAKRISPLIPVYGIKEGFSNNFNAELKDDDFRKKGVVETIKFYNPYANINYDSLAFDLEFLSENIFRVKTNVDFSKLHMITESGLLLNLACTLEDIQVMADHQSEISLPDINSKLIQVKVNDILKKSLKSKDDINLFNNYVYDQSITLREVINSGNKTIKDFLPVLEKSQKYKGWLADLPENNGLLNEYIKKVGEKTWIQSLPSKAIRFYIIGGIGALLKASASTELVIASTLGLSAFNTFVLENLIKTWKPNHFIQNELLPIVHGTK